MKVISFHSYKGGRGRTTAIASIANLYARTGKHVALLDVDVTAPWLHTRYDVPIETLESKGWLRGLLNDLEVNPSATLPNVDLDEYSIRVDALEKGSIRLLAPGNPESPDYWKWMAEEFPRFLGVTPNPTIRRLWKRLRTLIYNAKPRPDILLVDAQAGYHQASSYVAMAIADTAVLFAEADHADAAWTTKMVRSIRDSRPAPAKKRYPPLTVVGVRARYPDWVHTDFDSDDRFLRFQESYLPADFDSWVSLESDPRVELTNPDTPIPLSGPIHNTQLVRGYAELLAVALGNDRDYALDLLASLPEAELVPGERPQFFLLEGQGILTNPADRERNVSFRVETFCGLLEDLHTELERERLPGDAAALAVAGRAPGERFGKSLAEQFGHLDPSPDDEARLRRWCEFDSRVGFGGLDLAQIDQVEKGRATNGVIAVRGNFLADGRPADNGQGDLCPLLTGYIEGVLSMLLIGKPSHVAVSHPSTHCMRKTKGRSSCEFVFTVPSQRQAGVP